MWVIRELGLRLVATAGGTPDPAVNRLHMEARPSRWRRVVLWLRRVPAHEWFNEQITPRLAAVATLIE